MGGGVHRHTQRCAWPGGGRPTLAALWRCTVIARPSSPRAPCPTAAARCPSTTAGWATRREGRGCARLSRTSRPTPTRGRRTRAPRRQSTVGLRRLARHVVLDEGVRTWLGGTHTGSAHSHDRIVGGASTSNTRLRYRYSATRCRSGSPHRPTKNMSRTVFASSSSRRRRRCCGADMVARGTLQPLLELPALGRHEFASCTPINHARERFQTTR